MKKTIAFFSCVIMIISSILLVGCAKQDTVNIKTEASLNGRQIYTSSNGETEWYEFSGSSVTYGKGNKTVDTATYSVDEDKTLHINAGSNSKTTKYISVEEMLSMDYSDSQDYYAYNNEVLYYLGNDREFKKQ